MKRAYGANLDRGLFLLPEVPYRDLGQFRRSCLFCEHLERSATQGHIPLTAHKKAFKALSHSASLRTERKLGHGGRTVLTRNFALWMLE
jgi:hypothetical protein